MILPNDTWQRVLLICPHPDDETLGAGILLQEAVARRADIRVVFLTDGERNPIAQLMHDGQWPLTRTDRGRFGATRCREALRALQTLGVEAAAAEFWHLPDQGLMEACGKATAANVRMTALISEFQPTLVVSPTARDLHPDHLAAAHLTRRAIEATRLRTAHLTYRVHGELEYDSTSMVLADSSARLGSKSAAMNCHRTQLVVSRTRMLQLASRDEVFHEWEADAALGPIRFRRLQRLLHLLPVAQPPSSPVEEAELAIRP